MDETKQYILMCEKAEEIQKGWIPRRGDYIFFWHQDKEGFYWDFVCNPLGIKEQVSAIHFDVIYRWLPRQDQLQDMIFDRKNHTEVFYVSYFYRFVYEDLCSTSRDSNNWSMEQLWLAFVMKERYNKVWNSKEWEVKQ